MKTHRHIKHILQHSVGTVQSQFTYCSHTVHILFTYSHSHSLQYSMETVYSSPSSHVPSLETFGVKSDITLLAFEKTPKVFSIVS